MESKDMKTIVSELKDVISLEVELREGRSRKILDSDLAFILGVNPSILATSKNRNKILFNEINLFCAVRRISINLIYFSQSVESILDESFKFECHKYGLSA